MNNHEKYIVTLIYGLGVAFVCGLVGFYIYIWVRYGNLPPDEVPSWVHWLMLRR